MYNNLYLKRHDTLMDLDVVFNEDCIAGLKKIPDNSIDLIIADPPYNLSKGSNIEIKQESKLVGMGGNWTKVMQNWDDMGLSEYMDFTFNWLSEARRILKNTGSMWIFGTYHNIGLINTVCQMQGIEIINEVVWYKRNSFPNLAGRRLTASHETILWCNKGGKKREYYFNYEYSKDSYFPEDNLKIQGKQMRTVWDIPNNKTSVELKYGKHPTQKPIRLLERIVQLSSHKGDVCLTPFSGSGSECVAFKQLGRHYIGFEINPEYYQISLDRLKNTKVRTTTQSLIPMEGEEDNSSE